MTTNTKTSEQIRLMTISALLAAICLILTGYFQIKSPIGGYTHVGDAMIFLAGSILPAPYAVAVGVIGEGMADILSGCAVYFPATAVIKAITALVFTNKGEKIITKRNLLAIIAAFVFCYVGYVAYDTFLYGDFKAAALSIPSYVVQIGGSAILYIALGIALDKTGFKKKFFSK